MRIGINASFLRKPGTGIGQVTFNFLETLRGFSNAGVQSLVNDTNTEILLYTEEPVTLTLPENFTVRHFLPFWKRDDLIRKILWERQVAREAQKDQCDAFVSLYQSTTIAPRGIHHVMVVHDLIPRVLSGYQGNWRKRWYWRSVEKGIREADQLIAVSQSTKQDLVGFGIPPDRVHVAYPDTGSVFWRRPDPETAQAVLKRYGLVPGYLYHGGGLEIRKNTERILRAYRLLKDKEQLGTLPYTVPPLVISGKIFSETNLLATPVRSLITTLALEESVRLLNYVPEEDLPALYQSALFFVYPSLYEGFGLPVLEALRMGTAILTSSVSSIPEVAGERALYVDPLNVPAIASGMERLILDPAFRVSLCHAPQSGFDRFSWQKFTESVLHAVTSR